MNCDGLGNSLSHEKRNEFLLPRVARQPCLTGRVLPWSPLACKTVFWRCEEKAEKS